MIASEEYPNLDRASYLRQIDALAEEVFREQARTEEDRIEALTEVLVRRHDFRGNTEDFDNPENSYLNRVLRLRRGIPISVSTIWIDVASRLQWPVYGVNLPGHFLICFEGYEDRIWLDPFHGGERLTIDDCIHRVRRVCGDDREVTVGHLGPCNDRAILQRMLGNLLSIYARSKDWPRTVRVLHRQQALSPQSADICRQLAGVHMEIDEPGQAAMQLNRAYLLSQSDEEKATTAQLIKRLETILAQRN